MSPLLVIPREIRDEIISLVLLARRTPPQTPEEFEAIMTKEFREARMESWSLAKHIFYSEEPANYASNSTSLLLTCNQLYDETTANLKRLGNPYEIDIKLVKEQYLAPTWTCIPQFSDRLNAVRAVFRTCGVLETDEKTDIWRGGDGGGPSYVWMFYSVLDRFLRIGPVAKYSKTTPRRDISIQNLELEFVDPSQDDQAFLMPADSYRQWKEWEQDRQWATGSIDEKYVMHPSILGSKIRSGIESLLRMGYYTARYGAILYERIGVITLKWNDTVQSTYDLASMLAEIQFSDNFGSECPFGKRAEKWIAWVEQTMTARRSRGLDTKEKKKGWREDVRETHARLAKSR